MFPGLIVKNHGHNLLNFKAQFAYKPLNLDDNYDKLVYIVTAVILVLCSLFSTNINYYHTEFQCTTPTALVSRQFMIDYFQTHCWTHGVMPVRNFDEIPQTNDKWTELEAKYLTSEHAITLSDNITPLSPDLQPITNGYRTCSLSCASSPIFRDASGNR